MSQEYSPQSNEKLLYPERQGSSIDAIEGAHTTVEYRSNLVAERIKTLDPEAGTLFQERLQAIQEQAETRLKKLLQVTAALVLVGASSGAFAQNIPDTGVDTTGYQSSRTTDVPQSGTETMSSTTNKDAVDYGSVVSNKGIEPSKAEQILAVGVQGLQGIVQKVSEEATKKVYNETLGKAIAAKDAVDTLAKEDARITDKVEAATKLASYSGKIPGSLGAVSVLNQLGTVATRQDITTEEKTATILKSIASMAIPHYRIVQLGYSLIQALGKHTGTPSDTITRDPSRSDMLP